MIALDGLFAAPTPFDLTDCSPAESYASASRRRPPLGGLPMKCWQIWNQVTMLPAFRAVVFPLGFTAGRWYEHGR